MCVWDCWCAGRGQQSHSGSALGILVCLETSAEVGGLWAHLAPGADHCISGQLGDGTPFWESLPFLGNNFLDTPTCPVADGCGGKAVFPKKEKKLPKCS